MGLSEEKGDIAEAANIQMGWSAARRALRSPGSRSKLGCAGRPSGCSGPRPRGSPKMAPRCGA